MDGPRITKDRAKALRRTLSLPEVLLWNALKGGAIGRLHFRKQHPALIKGTIATLDAPDGVLLFTRQEGSEKLLCAYNMTERAVSVPLPAGISARSISAPGSVDEPLDGTLALPAFASFIGAIA